MPEHHHFDLADSRVHYLTASRPRDGFDKQMVARDIAQLLRSGLGIDSAHVVGHD